MFSVAPTLVTDYNLVVSLTVSFISGSKLICVDYSTECHSLLINKCEFNASTVYCLMKGMPLNFCRNCVKYYFTNILLVNSQLRDDEFSLKILSPVKRVTTLPCKIVSKKVSNKATWATFSILNTTVSLCN